mmetsp:Transcript_8997/g.11049  ORF Transcript_8997/g.11049 Transcript_8997/m.11049 type:complete len:332 (-) Transcript_8997:305-1300(-)
MTTTRWLTGEDNTRYGDDMTITIVITIAVFLIYWFIFCYYLTIVDFPALDNFNSIEDDSNSWLERQKRREDIKRRKFILQNVLMEKVVFKKPALSSSSPLLSSIAQHADNKPNSIQTLQPRQSDQYCETCGYDLQQNVKTIDADRADEKNNRQQKQSQQKGITMVKSTSKSLHSSLFDDYNKEESLPSNITTTMASQTNNPAKTTVANAPCEISNTCCSICCCQFNEGDDIIMSRNESCNHVFHKNCILAWLMHHSNCPYCRQDYFDCSYNDCNITVDSNEEEEEEEENADNGSSTARRRNEQGGLDETPPQYRQNNDIDIEMGGTVVENE